MSTPFTRTFFSKINVVTILILVLLSVRSTCQNIDSYSIKKIVIDAGHGGKDPGTIGKVSKEKDVALKIALKVGTYIEKNSPDVKVVYTRKNDVFIPLDERSRIANNAGADLFISIHCNANTNHTPYGTETYVMGLHKSSDNLDVAMRENGVITYEDDYSSKYEGYDPNSTESYIIFSMLQNAFLDQSLNFANLIQTGFREKANRKDRGVKQAGFLVLWKTSMPSVLVEVGYLSHPKEEMFLNSSEGQDYIASAIYRAFKDYKNNVDERNSIMAKNHFNHSTPSDTVSSNVKSPQAGPIPAIVFKVQVLASSKPLSPTSDQLKKLENVEEIQANGVYKYCVGNMQSYSDIVAYCQKIKNSYPDAFIIAMKEGEQIPVDVAIRELSHEK